MQPIMSGIVSLPSFTLSSGWLQTAVELFFMAHFQEEHVYVIIQIIEYVFVCTPSDDGYYSFTTWRSSVHGMQSLRWLKAQLV